MLKKYCELSLVARGDNVSKCLSVLVMAAVILFSSLSVAEEYRWWRDYDIWYLRADEPQAPAEHCQYYIAKNNFIARPGSAFSRVDIYACIFNYRDGTGGGAIYRRSGDACLPNTVYNPTTGVCANDQDKGKPEDLACAGNPINIASGNKFQMEVDYRGLGASSLGFARTYNSLDGVWRHNHSAYLRITKFSAALVLADGRESFFAVDGSTITGSPAELGKLTKTASGWLYSGPNDETYTFNAVGQLIRWTNTAGAQHVFVRYASGKVTVTDRFGQSLSYTEDALHQPLTLSIAGQTIKYDYNANRRLVGLVSTRGGQVEQRLFHYEYTSKPNLLTGITDERGIRYATWVYNAQGRAISSEHAGGTDKVLIRYNADGSSTVTNALGKKAIYRFQTIQGIKRITAIEGDPSVNCPNSNSTFTYDDRSLLKTKIDNKGHLTTYDYNERGLEVSHTEAAGTSQARTVTTEWHPTLFLPVTVTEPRRITHYTYDDQGRQLSQSVTQR